MRLVLRSKRREEPSLAVADLTKGVSVQCLSLTALSVKERSSLPV